jgi:membrane peptidoglycan carboxypeptidase
MNTKPTEEKILTLNHDGKKGVNIDKVKYDQVRNAILDVMKSQETITMADLSEAVKQKLEGKFDGKIGWYFMAVKLDLEVRGEIERVAKITPQTLRIKK